MPGVRIRVASGPDEGLEVALSRAEVRIGRGAGANVLLDDHGVSGVLRVRFAGGAYQVVNEVNNTLGQPTAVTFLDPDGDELAEFPPRTETVWYSDHQIRLTEDTLLVLTTDPDLNLPEGRFEATRSKPAAKAKKERDLVYIILIVILFGAAGLLFTMDPGGADKGQDRSVAQEFGDVEKGLRAVKDDPRTARYAEGVLDLLREARLAEVAARRGEAASSYAAARDELNRILGTPDAPPVGSPLEPDEAAPFRAAQAFVAKRLVDLSNYLGKNQPGR